jgi:hypothetical protein
MPRSLNAVQKCNGRSQTPPIADLELSFRTPQVGVPPHFGRLGAPVRRAPPRSHSQPTTIAQSPLGSGALQCGPMSRRMARIVRRAARGAPQSRCDVKRGTCLIRDGRGRLTSSTLSVVGAAFPGGLARGRCGLFSKAPQARRKRACRTRARARLVLSGVDVAPIGLW